MTNNPPKVYRRLGIHGSQCPWAKLNEDQVMEIREKHAHGWSRPALAAEYKVARKTIWEIVHWRTWAWMDRPGEDRAS